MFILSGLATPFASPALFSLPPARLPLSCCYFSSAGCLSGCPQVSPCCSPPELPHRSLIPGWRTLAPKKWGGGKRIASSMPCTRLQTHFIASQAEETRARCRSACKEEARQARRSDKNNARNSRGCRSSQQQADSLSLLSRWDTHPCRLRTG